MSIIFKHILRNIKSNKLKSILVIGSLMITTIVVFITLAIKQDIVLSYENLFRDTYKKYDLIVHKLEIATDTNFTKANLDLETPINGDSLSYQVSSAIYKFDNKNKPAYIYKMQLKDAEADDLLRVTKNSETLNNLKSNHILISENFAEKNNLKIGDSLDLTLGANPVNVEIVGLIENTGLIRNEGSYPIFIVSENFSLFDNPSSTFLLLKNTGSDSLEKIEKKFEKNNPDYLISPTIDKEAINKSVSMFDQVMLIILAIVLLLNITIISSITKLLITSKIPVIGTFRSVGATKKKMDIILLFENVVYGLLGGILGIIVAVLIKEPIGKIFLDLLGNSGQYEAQVDKNYLIYLFCSILFSILLITIVSLKSILEIGKKPVKNMMFDTISSQYKLSKSTIVIGILLIFISIVLVVINKNYDILTAVAALLIALLGSILVIPLLNFFIAKILSFFSKLLFGVRSATMGLRSISASKTVVSSVTMISVAISIMLMLYMLSTSMTSLINSSRASFKGDIQVSGFTKDEKAYEYLRDISGVSKINYEYYATMKMKRDNSSETIYLVGADNSQLGIDLQGNKPKKLLNNEILVDELFANKNELKLGDKIEIESSYLNKSKKYTIAGFINSVEFTMYRNVFLLNQKEYKHSFTQIPAVASITINPDTTIEKTESNLLENVGNVSLNFESIDDFMNNQKSTIDGLIMMVYVILSLSLLLTFIGTINNQIIGLIERRKEFSILYSVAMNYRQISLMLISESFGIFLSSSLIGSMLGFLFCHILEKILYSLGIFVSITFDINLIFIVLAAFFAVIMLTVIIPIIRLRKINIVEELKGE